MLYLMGNSFQSLTAAFKQSSGRARVLASRHASKHHTGAGQTGKVEDLRTSVTNETKETYEGQNGSKRNNEGVKLHDRKEKYQQNAISLK